MEVCVIFLAIVLTVGYGTAHSIVANILGHGILSIAHPATYVATLPSAVFTPLYGTPLFFAGACVVIATVFALATLCAHGTTTTARMIIPLEVFLPIPAGVIINIFGVLIINRYGIHGFHGQLPCLTDAARVGAVGQTVLIGIHGWRLMG